MLNPKKVRLRMKAEAVRQRERGRVFKISSHSRGGYVARGMLKALIGITSAFVLAVFLVILFARYNPESFHAVSGNRSLAVYAAVYAVLAAVYLIAAFFHFRKKYDKAAECVDEFDSFMDSLDDIQE